MDKTDREARLLRRAPFAVVELDSSLRLVAWNDAAARMFAVDEAWAFGAAVDEVLPVDAAGFWAGLAAGESGAPRRVSVGALVVEWTADALHDEAGRVVSVACYGRDITARAADESVHKLEGTMLRAILGNLNIVVWTMERDGLCTYHAGAGLASIGESANGFVGKNIRAMYGSGGSAAFDRVFAGELVFVSQDSHGQSFDNWMIPMRDESGDVALLVAVSLNVTEQRRGERALRDRLAQIEDQQRTIRALSTPIVEVWDRVLTLPIIGIVDTDRATEIMENLLHAVTSTRARFAILDLTGVTDIDTGTAGHLLAMVRAIRLLGAEGVVTGIHPNIARTIVDLGVELPNLVVRASLREALELCISRLNAVKRR